MSVNFLNLILFVFLSSIVTFNVADLSKQKWIRSGRILDPRTSLEGRRRVFLQMVCPGSIKCVPLIQCPAHVQTPREHPSLCDLPDGTGGVCCLTGQNHTVSMGEEPAMEERAATQIMKEVAKEARNAFEKEVQRVVIAIPKGNPDFLHHMVFRASPAEEERFRHMVQKAMESVFAAKIYRDQENVPKEEFQLNKLSIRFATVDSDRFCPSTPPCDNVHSTYRNPDGSCNNPLPWRRVWGAAGQPMERLLPPYYEDGIWSPRSVSLVDGSPLTSARTISRVLIKDVDRPHPFYNLLVMQFGQFLSHDFTQSASITLDDGTPIQCCTPDGSSVLPQDKLHFACLPIVIEPNDEFYSAFNQGCMNLVRSSLAPRQECRLGYGKQLSKVSHFIDGSVIYGSDLDTQRTLREFRGGRLRMFEDFGRELLPLTNDPDVCESIEKGNTCFLAGDGRVNQIISLTTVQVVFAREHNKIAGILAKLNPDFPDEVLFQEARRIVVAELQHITYNEFLPLIVGPDAMTRFGLEVLHKGYSSEYDIEVNPAITNEFSAAAYRFGHSTVDGKFKLRNSKGNEDIDIPDVMFNPTRLRVPGFLDDLLNTLVDQPMQEVDSFVTHGLSRFLFRGRSPFGMDLASLNIQRGRDHAIGPYNDYLELIGYNRVKSFDEFGPVVGPKLAKVYKHPDDIDLWVGGLLEAAVDHGLVGVTFSEIIADQFSRFRQGDRYFYDNDPSVNPGFFKPDQLQEIRKVTLARILCDNSDRSSFTSSPVFALIQSNVHGNPTVPCDSNAIPSMNYKVFRQ